MSKTRRLETVTSGDKFPQKITFSVTESSAGTYTDSEVTIPVLRGNIGRNRYQVIEVLGFDFSVTTGDMADGSVRSWQVTTNNQSSLSDFSDQNVLYTNRIANSLNTEGYVLFPRSHFYRFPGPRGPIVATQSIYVAIQGASETNPLSLRGCMWYRFVEIGAMEFATLSIQQSNT